MPTPRLYLHIGPAKTGTSALQHVLAEHDGSQVLYPRTGRWADGSHHNLVFGLLQDHRRPQATRDPPEKLLASLAAEAGVTDRPLCISSEALGPARATAFLAAVTGAIGCTLADCRILYVCREHYARAASLYSQRVKDAHQMERRSPSDFLRAAAPNLLYAPALRLLAEAAPLTVLNYHPAEDFLPRILVALGFLPEALPANPRRNASLNVRGIIALLAANRVATDPAHRSLVAKPLAALRHRFGSSGLLFDAASTAEAHPHFAADRAVLELDWNIVLPPPSPPEPAAFCLRPQDWQELAAICNTMGRQGEAVLEQARPYAP